MSDDFDELAFKSAIRKWLASHSLPPNLLQGVFDAYKSIESQLVVIENSSFMKTRDGHVGRIRSDGCIDRVDSVTRWEEMNVCIAHHNNFAANCWMPTKYWLLNKPTGLMEGHSKKFALCWNTKEDIADEMNHIKRMMKNITLDQSQCQLTRRIGQLAESIAKEAPSLLARGKKISVILYTQGVPTNSKGQSSATIRQEFREQLYSLVKLPVNVIIRLTTGDEKALSMFNDMDARFHSLDVLDNYWGEAMEVYLHNPWLTYSIGLHRLREVGLVPSLGILDERPLSLDEIHQLCQLLFVGEDTSVRLPLPPYQPTGCAQLRRSSWVDDWLYFVYAIDDLLEKEKLQWNPVKKRMTPWIDIKKLESSLSEQCRRTQSAHSGRPSQRKPEQRGGKPSNNPDRRNTYSGSSNGAQSQHRRGKYRSTATAASVPNTVKEDLSLKEIVQQWSHQPPNYKRYNSLQDLLVTVPRLFPPMNNTVEEHIYFTKWMTFSKDAFADLSDDDLKPLLQRALRKAKFFLHPDKLPNDLTDNQTNLFRTIWNIIREREEKVLG